MDRNEETSKIVASRASYVLLHVDKSIADLNRCMEALSSAVVLLREAKSVAASALTQSPDKKKAASKPLPPLVRASRSKKTAAIRKRK